MEITTLGQFADPCCDDDRGDGVTLQPLGAGAHTHRLPSVQTSKGAVRPSDQTRQPDQSSTDSPFIENVSQPPSPPDSGTSTPSLRRGPCPDRLTPVIPPPNYGASENGTLFRSGFPSARNISFLKMLKIKHVLCLVDSVAPVEYDQWLNRSNISSTRLHIMPNKDGMVRTTSESICQALFVLLDPANYPVYVHCNQGRHRTGCIIACLRKVQRWPIDEIITEYEAYAIPKARSGDIAMIRAFNPTLVYEYFEGHDSLGSQRILRRNDSIGSEHGTLFATSLAGAFQKDRGASTASASDHSAISTGSDNFVSSGDETVGSDDQTVITSNRNVAHEDRSGENLIGATSEMV